MGTSGLAQWRSVAKPLRDTQLIGYIRVGTVNVSKKKTLEISNLPVTSGLAPSTSVKKLFSHNSLGTARVASVNFSRTAPKEKTAHRVHPGCGPIEVNRKTPSEKNKSPCTIRVGTVGVSRKNIFSCKSSPRKNNSPGTCGLLVAHSASVSKPLPKKHLTGYIRVGPFNST